MLGNSFRKHSFYVQIRYHLISVILYQAAKKFTPAPIIMLKYMRSNSAFDTMVCEIVSTKSLPHFYDIPDFILCNVVVNSTTVIHILYSLNVADNGRLAPRKIVFAQKQTLFWLSLTTKKKSSTKKNVSSYDLQRKNQHKPEHTNTN